MKKIALGIVLIMVVAYFTFNAFSTGFHDIAGAFGRVSLIPLLLFIGISIANLIVYTMRWDVILHAGKARIVPFSHMLWARFAAYAVGYVVPSAQLGGEPLKLLFLQKHKVGKKEGLASIILDKMFEAAIMTIFGTVALTIVILSTQGAVSEESSYVVLGLGVLLLVLYFVLTIYNDGFFTVLMRVLRLHRVRKCKGLIQKVAEVEAMMKHFFVKHRKELFSTVILTLSTYILFILEYVVLFIALGLPVNISQLIVASTLPMIAYLVPLPGAVGAFEASQIAALNLAGIDPVYALPLIIYIRVRDFVFIAIGIVAGSKEGLSFFGKKKHTSTEHIH